MKDSAKFYPPPARYIAYREKDLCTSKLNESKQFQNCNRFHTTKQRLTQTKKLKQKNKSEHVLSCTGLEQHIWTRQSQAQIYLHE